MVEADSKRKIRRAYEPPVLVKREQLGTILAGITEVVVLLIGGGGG